MTTIYSAPPTKTWSTATAQPTISTPTCSKDRRSAATAATSWKANSADCFRGWHSSARWPRCGNKSESHRRPLGGITLRKAKAAVATVVSNSSRPKVGPIAPRKIAKACWLWPSPFSDIPSRSPRPATRPPWNTIVAGCFVKHCWKKSSARSPPPPMQNCFSRRSSTIKPPTSLRRNANLPTQSKLQKPPPIQRSSAFGRRCWPATRKPFATIGPTFSSPSAAGRCSTCRWAATATPEKSPPPARCNKSSANACNACRGSACCAKRANCCVWRATSNGNTPSAPAR